MTKKHLNSSRLTAILVVLFAIVYFYLNILMPKMIPNFLRVGIPRAPMNVLFIGTDTNFNIDTLKAMPNLLGRSDTIMLAHIDPIIGRINILSIPRDTYTNVPGFGWTKINASTVYGGPPLLKQAVEKLTDQKIDHYIQIKPTMIPGLVNTVGGIKVYIEKDMYYNDIAQNLHINLKQGWQKLNGDQAHQFIRFRHDFEGDIGRVRRQQQFFGALTAAMLKPGNLVRVPFSIYYLLGQIHTDLPINEALRLANFSRMAKIKTATLSGEAVNVDYAGSIWRVDNAAMKEQLKEFFK